MFIREIEKRSLRQGVSCDLDYFCVRAQGRTAATISSKLYQLPAADLPFRTAYAIHLCTSPCYVTCVTAVTEKASLQVTPAVVSTISQPKVLVTFRTIFVQVLCAHAPAI